LQRVNHCFIPRYIPFTGTEGSCGCLAPFRTRLCFVCDHALSQGDIFGEYSVRSMRKCMLFHSIKGLRKPILSMTKQGPGKKVQAPEKVEKIRSTFTLFACKAMTNSPTEANAAITQGGVQDLSAHKRMTQKPLEAYLRGASCCCRVLLCRCLETGNDLSSKWR